MKKLFEEQKVSLYQVQQDLGMTINRLYRIASGYVSIRDVSIRTILDLAYYFKMTPQELIRKIESYQKKQKEERSNEQ